MAELELAFLLPVAGWPRAVFEGDYSYEGGRLLVDGAVVAQAQSRVELERGVEGALPVGGAPLVLRLVSERGAPQVQVSAGGQPAVREDRLRARPTRSAWTHAVLALAGSGAGFVASYLYLMKSSALQDEWALKMGNHMAGWHLLLTFTLFPASVWGQRIGIRAVQLVSLLFFLIHAGIAIANLGPSNAPSATDSSIAVLNAASGLLFLATTIYGNRAWRDMDPVAALRRIGSSSH